MVYDSIITMWKKQYQQKKFYWGLKPESGLKEAIKYARKGKALDIGAGEGRNSIFLAKNGFDVEAIDKTKEGLEKCKNFARKYHLSIKTKMIDIKRFKFKKNQYSLILSIAVLDFLRLSETKKIIKTIHYALVSRGTFYLLVFSTKDPAYKKCRNQKLKTIEKNTFFLPKIKTFRHFFQKRELLNLLKDFKIITMKEKRKRDIHNKIHFHHLIRIVAKK